MEINADLHIHSRYSMATSPRMDVRTIAAEARRKGIQLVGTGDCLHPKWRSEIRTMRESEGAFNLDGTNFILTVEVEDSSRTHHLIIVPSLSKAEELYECLSPYSKDIDTDGRATVRLDGSAIAEYAVDAGALIGPAHAFTPWTGMYAAYNSLTDCYGDLADRVSFLELGLSADSSYGDCISELGRLTFLTNSDAHSPWPIRFAREFNRLDVKDVSFEEVRMAILRENGRRILLNIGMPPQEGKYNESACTKCYRHYTLEDAANAGWRCECGGRIKKGVRDRVRELAAHDKPGPPSHSPPYLPLIPLAEIIGMVLKVNANTKRVNSAWEVLVGKFGSEVKVLVDSDIGDEGFNLVDGRIRDAVRAFRSGRITIHPGGGGSYGTVELPDKTTGEEQMRLGDF